MADLSDVTRKLVEIATAAVYPDGVGEPSISGNTVRLYEGWPEPNTLDADLIGKMPDPNTGKLMAVPNWFGPISHVSVFAQPGASATFQCFEPDFVLQPAVHALTASISGTTVTCAGAPGAKEYLSLVIDRRRSYSRVGATLVDILAALLVDILVDYPAATADATSITIPNAHAIDARIGANAVLGRQIHRQRQQVMVTVWAPSPNERSALAKAIDVACKKSLRLTFPDSSQGLLTFERTTQTDEGQLYRVYRRDLVYTVEFATIETFDAFEVTSVSVDLDGAATVAK